MISLCVVTYNEEHRIRGCIESALPLVDEVVVVDQSSTDDTARVAKEAGAVVVTDEHHGYCEPSRPLAIDIATGDWLLLLDADEKITPEFIDDAPKIMRRYKGAFLCIEAYVAGERILPDQRMPRFRFFQRGEALLPTNLHNAPKPKVWDGSVYETPYFAIIHEKSQAEHDLDVERYASFGVAS